MATFSSSKVHGFPLLLLILVSSIMLSPVKCEYPTTFPPPIGIYQVKQCLKALPGISGACTSDILKYLVGPRDGIINLKCCKAVIKIVSSCRLRNLPIDPIFPPMVLGVCARNYYGSLEPWN